jgi:ubiquitin carboxyl-terminal hydrolase MINDY-3/4
LPKKIIKYSRAFKSYSISKSTRFISEQSLIWSLEELKITFCFFQLWVFEFNKLDDLQIFIKRYIFYFTDDPGPGALLFLYSAVWTRGFENVRTDLDSTKGAHLMGNYEEGSLNIVTLLLSGRATPYLHNGVVYVGDEDHYALPQFGILCRSRVGLLIW